MIRLRSQNRFADDTFSMVKSYVIKGNLLSFQILEGLAESKNLDDLVIKLRGTNYVDTVSRVQPSFTANKLENAFLGRLADVYSKVVKVAPKTNLLDAYYLKYIGLNLKVILKGKAQQKKEDEI
ncbi:MAG TPA: V-type ATPase subunit, partial [Nitrososphaerales archaeon]